MKLIEITKEQFADFTNDFENVHYTQITGMEELIPLRGNEYNYLGLEDDQGQLQFATLLTRVKLRLGQSFVIKTGPLVMDLLNKDILPIWLTELKDYAKREGALDLYFIPDLPQKIVSESNTETLNKDVIDNISSQDFVYESLGQGIDQRFENWVYKKDLRGLTEQTLWDSYENNARHSIVRAEKYGVEVRPLAYDELDKFKDVSEHTAERVGYNNKSLEYYQTVYKNAGNRVKFLVAEVNFKKYRDNLLQIRADLEKEVAEIDLHLEKYPNNRKKINQKREFLSQIEAQQNRIDEAEQWVIDSKVEESTVLAAGMFLYTKNTVYYLLSGSYDHYNKLNAPFLIQHRIMQEAVNNDVEIYNMLGIDGDFSGADSIYEFKKSFAGYAEQKVGMFHWIAQPLKYKMIEGLKEILGRN